MQEPSTEVIVALLAGVVLALLLVGFIVTIFFQYQKRRKKQEEEIVVMKDKYEKELLQSQLEIQEATLQGVAQELHDNMGQVLSVVKLWLASLPVEKGHPAFDSLQESRQMLNKVIYDMSDLTKSLHTDRIADIGLAEAIRFDVATLRKTPSMDFDLSVGGVEFPFAGQKAIFLFRIYQEMINNILKHSKASHVKIEVLYVANNTFVMSVQDDGIGFDLKAKKTQQSGSSGLGLKNMLKRAQLIGAEVKMDSEPGKGTRIRIEMQGGS